MSFTIRLPSCRIIWNDNCFAIVTSHSILKAERSTSSHLFGICIDRSPDERSATLVWCWNPPDRRRKEFGELQPLLWGGDDLFNFQVGFISSLLSSKTSTRIFSQAFHEALATIVLSVPSNHLTSSSSSSSIYISLLINRPKMLLTKPADVCVYVWLSISSFVLIHSQNTSTTIHT